MEDKKLTLKNRPASVDLTRGLVLLAIGTAGAWLARAAHVPAGTVVGPLIASGVYSLVGGETGAWRQRYGRSGRLLLGAVIGAAFTPAVLAQFQGALLPMLVLVTILIGVSFLLGWGLSHFTTLNESTGLVSSMPGGLPAMAAVSEEMGADATIVTTIHFTRLMTILLVVPALIPMLVTTSGHSTAIPTPNEAAGLWRATAALAVGLAGGLLAIRQRVPTGDLVGPILAVGIANLLGLGLGPLPEVFRTTAMVLIGIDVGAQMSRESFRALRSVALPASIVVGAIVVSGLSLGWGLSRVTSLDLATALLSSVPGGASTMPAVAHELGGDMRLVAALHLTRQLVILVLLPSILGYLLRSAQRK